MYFQTALHRTLWKACGDEHVDGLTVQFIYFIELKTEMRKIKEKSNNEVYVEFILSFQASLF